MIYAECHPRRQMVRDGRCRECAQVASTPAEDPLPAMIAGTTQAAGPEYPDRCGKCGGLWIDQGTWLHCYACGGTWHRTSNRLIRPPPEQPPQWRAYPGGRVKTL